MQTQSLGYHNMILMVHACQLANESNICLISDSDHSGRQRKGTKCFFEPTRKSCGFGAAARRLLVSWFTVEAKCIMRAL